MPRRVRRTPGRAGSSTTNDSRAKPDWRSSTGGHPIGVSTWGDGNEISVLLTADHRLQIMADVDADGLAKLEQMITQYITYKEILTLLQ
jgi:hypothetical protein